MQRCGNSPPTKEEGRAVWMQNGRCHRVSVAAAGCGTRGAGLSRSFVCVVRSFLSCACSLTLFLLDLLRLGVSHGDLDDSVGGHIPGERRNHQLTERRAAAVVAAGGSSGGRVRGAKKQREEGTQHSTAQNRCVSHPASPVPRRQRAPTPRRSPAACVLFLTLCFLGSHLATKASAMVKGEERRERGNEQTAVCSDR